MLLSLNCLNLIFHGTFWQVLAEGESKYGYIALIRTRSPKFKKYLRHKRRPFAGPHARSSPTACNLHTNMGWSVG